MVYFHISFLTLNFQSVRSFYERLYEVLVVYFHISFLTLNFQSVRSFYERLYEVLVLIVTTLMTEHLVSFLVCRWAVTCIWNILLTCQYCILRFLFEGREGWEGFAEPWDDFDFTSWFNSWLGWLVLTLPLDALQVFYCFVFYYRLFILFLYTLKWFYFQIVKVLAKI